MENKMTIDVGDHDTIIRITSDIGGDIGSIILSKDGLTINDCFTRWDAIFGEMEC